MLPTPVLTYAVANPRRRIHTQRVGDEVAADAAPPCLGGHGETLDVPAVAGGAADREAEHRAAVAAQPGPVHRRGATDVGEAPGVVAPLGPERVLVDDGGSLVVPRPQGPRSGARPGRTATRCRGRGGGRPVGAAARACRWCGTRRRGRPRRRGGTAPMCARRGPRPPGPGRARRSRSAGGRHVEVVDEHEQARSRIVGPRAQLPRARGCAHPFAPTPAPTRSPVATVAGQRAAGPGVGERAGSAAGSLVSLAGP